MSVLKQDNGFGDAVLRVVSLQALHAEKSSNCILPFLVHERADFTWNSAASFLFCHPRHHAGFVWESKCTRFRERRGGEGAREIKNEMTKDVRWRSGTTCIYACLCLCCVCELFRLVNIFLCVRVTVAYVKARKEKRKWGVEVSGLRLE